MKTGIKKAANGLLKVAITLCVLFSLANLAGFALTRVPPYSEGACLATPNPFLSLKVSKNHILAGYSDVEADMLGMKEKGKLSFMDLRSPAVKEVDCPNE